MMCMMKILQNSVTFKDAGGQWRTLTPGMKFTALNKLGEVYEYVFVDRDFFAMPHGEDYWTIRGEDYMMSVETEWFRQRWITCRSEVVQHVVSIRQINSEWGTDYACFTVPKEINIHDVTNAMRFALAEIEENGKHLNPDDGVAEINQRILETVALDLEGTFNYIEVGGFEYDFDWSQTFGEEEEDEDYP